MEKVWTKPLKSLESELYERICRWGKKTLETKHRPAVRRWQWRARVKLVLLNVIRVLDLSERLGIYATPSNRIVRKASQARYGTARIPTTPGQSKPGTSWLSSAHSKHPPSVAPGRDSDILKIYQDFFLTWHRRYAPFLKAWKINSTSSMLCKQVPNKREVDSPKHKTFHTSVIPRKAKTSLRTHIVSRIFEKTRLSDRLFMTPVCQDM